MPRAKSIIYLASFVVLGLVLLACYIILSGRTFTADLVAGIMRDVIEKSGPFSFSWDSTRGNPLTGIYITNAKISSGDIELGSVGEIGLHIALTKKFSPPVKLSRLTLSELVTDFDNFSGISFAQNEDSGPSPVDNLYINNSTLRTPWGTFDLESAFIGLGVHANRNATTKRRRSPCR